MAASAHDFAFQTIDGAPLPLTSFKDKVVLVVNAPECQFDVLLGREVIKSVAIKGLVGQHIKRLGMYRCEQCGFRAKQYHWRCPGCGKWETYTPRRTETPEGYVA